jgi:hypothetical protein
MSMFGKRKPTPRKATKPAILSLHVKRSAELWLDTFEQAVFVYLGEEGDKPRDLAISNAHQLADAVVDAFEQRWPGVKL